MSFNERYVDERLAGKIKQMLGLEWPDGTAIKKIKFRDPSQCTECGTDFWDAKHPKAKNNFNVQNFATYFNESQTAERSADDDSICTDCVKKN